MVMLVEGGEFNHSSSGGTAADNVDEGVVMAETCTCDCTAKSRSGPPDQIGRIWRCRGIF